MKLFKNTLLSITLGAISGLVSTIIFMIIHDIFISNIWYTFIFMVLAGILCGASVAWSYQLLFEFYSAITWLRYNSIFIIMFSLLGLASVLTFEPVTSVAALIVANERPDELIKQAGPMTAIFTLITTVILSILYGRSWIHYFAILVTCSVLIIVLGFNVSILGLVYFPSRTLYLILEMFGLILVIVLVYAIFYVILRKFH